MIRCDRVCEANQCRGNVFKDCVRGSRRPTTAGTSQNQSVQQLHLINKNQNKKNHYETVIMSLEVVVLIST